MGQPLKIALALAIASALCRPAAAEGRVRFETDLSIERVSGFTTYQIGGDFTSGDGVSGTYRFPLSELEFPLNVFMTTVSAGLTIDEKFVVRAKYRHNNLFGAHKFASKQMKNATGTWSGRRAGPGTLYLLKATHT